MYYLLWCSHNNEIAQRRNARNVSLSLSDANLYIKGKNWDGGLCFTITIHALSWQITTIYTLICNLFMTTLAGELHRAFLLHFVSLVHCNVLTILLLYNLLSIICYNKRIISMCFNCKGVASTSVLSCYITVALSEDGRNYLLNPVLVNVMNKWIYSHF